MKDFIACSLFSLAAILLLDSTIIEKIEGRNVVAGNNYSKLGGGQKLGNHSHHRERRQSLKIEACTGAADEQTCVLTQNLGLTTITFKAQCCTTGSKCMDDDPVCCPPAGKACDGRCCGMQVCQDDFCCRSVGFMCEDKDCCKPSTCVNGRCCVPAGQSETDTAKCCPGLSKQVGSNTCCDPQSKTCSMRETGSCCGRSSCVQDPGQDVELGVCCTPSGENLQSTNAVCCPNAMKDTDGQTCCTSPRSPCSNLDKCCGSSTCLNTGFCCVTAGELKRGDTCCPNLDTEDLSPGLTCCAKEESDCKATTECCGRLSCVSNKCK